MIASCYIYTLMTRKHKPKIYAIFKNSIYAHYLITSTLIKLRNQTFFAFTILLCCLFPFTLLSGLWFGLVIATYKYIQSLFLVVTID